MMLICWKCGEAFDDSECVSVSEYHSEVDASERFAACPHCGCTELVKAEHCSECGEVFWEEELAWGGTCEECLKKAADADTFLQFALDDRATSCEVGTLEDFIFSTYLGIFDLKQSSEELKEHCLEFYNAYKTADDFRDKVILYLEELNLLQNEFAEWLADQKKESRHD